MDLKGVNNDVIISSIEKEQELFQVLLETIEESFTGDNEPDQDLLNLEATLIEYLEKVLYMANSALDLLMNLMKAFHFDLVEDIVKHAKQPSPGGKLVVEDENKKS